MKGRPSVVVQPSPPVVVTQKPQIIYKPGPTRYEDEDRSLEV